MATSNKVTARTPLDTRVGWGAGMKPTAFPHTEGYLFMVKGKAAWVKWDTGNGTPVPVFIGALVRL